MTGSRLAIALAVIALAVVGVVVGLDWLITTDQEAVDALLYQLATAVEQNDKATVLAGIDPNVPGLQAEAEQIMREVRATSVKLTSVETKVNLLGPRPTARSDVFVRAALKGKYQREAFDLQNQVLRLAVDLTRNDSGQWWVVGYELVPILDKKKK